MLRTPHENVCIFDRDVVERANIAINTAAAEIYAGTEPHYRQENVTRVRSVLARIAERTRGSRLLDMGCGAGFIIEIASEFFPFIRGIDITEAMLAKVNTVRPGSDIRVQIARSDEAPFGDGSFDVCTSNALLHHLYDIRPTIAEACRVLSPGGVFYSDLDPNFYYWEALGGLPTEGDYWSAVAREIHAVTSKEEELAKQLSVSRETIQQAEPIKHIGRGFREEALRSACLDAGFSSVEIGYNWFLGEGVIIRGVDSSLAAGLREYLLNTLPLSRHLFKYVSILARK